MSDDDPDDVEGDTTPYVTKTEKGTVIITDDNVKKLYGSRFPKVPVFSLLPGESSKKLEVIEDMAGKLLAEGTDRAGFILAR